MDVQVRREEEDGDASERIRAVREFAPGSLPPFRKRPAIADEKKVLPVARMIRKATAGAKPAVRRTRGVFELAAQACAVETGDILIRRMQYHADQAWMLRGYLQRVEGKAKAA
jgi:starvation-inducible DNA-binding protein